MLTAILALAGLAALFGLGLGYAAIRFRIEGDPLVEKIDKILPQTQCGQCGYPGCRPYATAIAANEADINQCPPGGEDGILKLAELLGRESSTRMSASAAPSASRPARSTRSSARRSRCIP
jgi:Na+-translocating ferredoxin:NAD+ oxidoreductase subunit B